MPNKRVLFVAPRFHTNQYILIKNLINYDIEVNFLSVYIGGSENHKYLTPILSKPSWIVKWYLKKYTQLHPNEPFYIKTAAELDVLEAESAPFSLL